MASDILVVDDEHDIREIVSGILSDEGHETRTAHDSDSALAAISDRVPRLIFLDIWMQGSKLDGLSLLDEIKTRHPELPVVMISGHGNIETAVSAIKRGAFDFIEKPFKADRLILIAERALENSKLKREVSELKRRTGDALELIGTSVAVSQLRQTIEKVSPTNSRIMRSSTAARIMRTARSRLICASPKPRRPNSSAASAMDRSLQRKIGSGKAFKGDVATFRSLRPRRHSPLDRLRCLPDFLHPLQRCVFQRLAFCFKNLFYMAEPTTEFRIRSAHCLFRIGLDVTADIDDREDQVAELVADLCLIAFAKGCPQFADLLLDLVEDRLRC